MCVHVSSPMSAEVLDEIVTWNSRALRCRDSGCLYNHSTELGPKNGWLLSPCLAGCFLFGRGNLYRINSGFFSEPICNEIFSP